MQNNTLIDPEFEKIYDEDEDEIRDDISNCTDAINFSRQVEIFLKRPSRILPLQNKYLSSFEEQCQKLKIIIKEYLEHAEMLAKHGWWGKKNAIYLWKSILDNTAYVEDEKAKIAIMRYQLKRFIATGKNHFFIPASGNDENSLRGKIITEFFEKPVAKIPETIAKERNKTHNHFSSKKEINQQELSSKLDEYKIPVKGISSFAIVCSYARLLEPHVYAHFRLKVISGIPCNIFNQPLSEGVCQFVILTNNEFRFLPTLITDVKDASDYKYLLSHIKYRAHDQIAGKNNVYSAGEFAVLDKKIIWVDGGSGHYGTSDIKFVNYAVDVLKKMGIDTENIEKKSIPKLGWKKEILRLIGKQTQHFFSGIFSPGEGERIEKRPPIEKFWKSKIPRFK